MGRGRGKGKKQTAVAAHEDGNGEEEKALPNRKRGRPQKLVKNEIEEKEEEAEEIEGTDKNGENKEVTIVNEDVKDQAAVENRRKRKSSSQIKENPVSVKLEDGDGNKISTDCSVKAVGFRQIGSRRKNKPRRAAEVGVECI